MRLAIVDDTPAVSLAVSDETDPTAADPETAAEPVTGDEDGSPAASAQTRWLLVVEGAETGDGRSIEEGALTWRDLPLPLMATDITDEGHDGAQLVARIVEIEREGSKVYGVTEMIDSTDPGVLRLQKLIDDGDLKGVSVDMDKVEGNMVIAETEATENEDGTIEVDMAAPKFRITAARIMGATAVPFPAFAEAGKIAAALVAGAMTVDRAVTLTLDDDAADLVDAVTALEDGPLLEALLRLVEAAGASVGPDDDETEDEDGEDDSEGEVGFTASIQAPVEPPAAWFLDPEFSSPTPLTVTDDGRLTGHVALWNSCHRGFDTCEPPPRAPNGDYSHFHTGTIVTAEGSRVSVGNITVDCGHAPMSDNAVRAKQHYDNSGWNGAEVVCGEDRHGIWMAGAVRSDLTPERLRALLAVDVSGDWRAINGPLRLIGLASIPVPGFVKTQVASGALSALVASVPVCEDPAVDLDAESGMIADRIALSIGRHRDQIQGERDKLAFGVGRHPAQRRAELAARYRS